MATTLFPAPQHILFRTTLSVQIGDINYGNHLANDAVLRLIHEMRLRWLATGGLNEMNIDGVGLIMARAHLHYQAQAFYGDELDFAVGMVHMQRTNFTLHTAIQRIVDQVNIAQVQTNMAFFDYTRQKIARMPPSFQRFLHQQGYDMALQAVKQSATNSGPR